MKFRTCLLLSLVAAAGLLAAEDQPVKPASRPAAKVAPKPAAKPARKAPVPITVPADAVQVSPGLYRWADKDGKGWMFRKTPFGVSRWEEESEDTKQKAVVSHTTAVEQGDSVRFERVSPFGKQTWVKKKTDLDETEQKIWARQKDNNSASRSTEKE